MQAKSGTGKTLVFSIISLENIIIESKVLQTLILAPTREIALQIHDVIKKININRKTIVSHVFIGGQSLNEDKLKLKLCHIAIGTPGIYSFFFNYFFLLQVYIIKDLKMIYYIKVE